VRAPGRASNAPVVDSHRYIPYKDPVALGSSSLRHVRLIVDTVLSASPRSVLDLGMGTGKYGFLLREQHDLAQLHGGTETWQLRLVGVEAYSPYVGDIQRFVYDDVVIADAQDYLVSCQESFDFALVLDLLEHFPPDRGRELMSAALTVAGQVVVLTPRGFYPQEGHANTLERHLSWWPVSAIRRLAHGLDAEAVTARTRGATIAVLSRTKPAAIAMEDRWAEVLTDVRDRLVPEGMWFRLRGKAGPMLV
jgi:hypothetical protein